MSILRRSRRRRMGAIAVSATFALGAGLLVGATPVTASPGAGIVVSAAIVDGSDVPNQLVFRATPAMQESEITVTREGPTVTITESEGGPSLVLQPPTDSRISCAANDASAMSDGIRCTFSGATSSQPYMVFGEFADAPRGVTFGSGESVSPLRLGILGSPYDDFFEGGPLDDVIAGGAGDDYILGRGGDDRLAGQEGDDVIYGEGDDAEREKGNDALLGGPGADYLEGGPGSDEIVGGPGLDDLNAKDEQADALVDCNDNDSRGQETEDLVFDIRLDRPVDCGVNEAPDVLVPPALTGPSGVVSAGDVIRGTPATWRGTNPMTFSYTWTSCALAADGDVEQCKVIGAGKLDAKGRDARTGKAPEFRVRKSDTGRVIQFNSIADNSQLRGGALTTATSNPSSVIEPGIQLKFPPWTMPFLQKRDNRWLFPTTITTITGEPKPTELLPWLKKSEIVDNITISFDMVPRTKVPQQWRRDIRVGDAFEIEVDGVKVTKESPVVEVSRSGKSEVVIRLWSDHLDTLKCGMNQAEIAAWNKRVGSLPTDVMTVVDALESRGCRYSLVFLRSPALGDSSWLNQSIAQVASLEEYSDPDDGFSFLLVRAYQPAAGALSLSVGAPPRDQVAQAPDQPTIGISGQLPSYGDAHPFGAVWIGLSGDQARQPNTPTRVDIFQTDGKNNCDFVNYPGAMGCSARFFSKGVMRGDFNTTLSVPLQTRYSDGENGIRILVTTYHDVKKADDTPVVRAQVFVDIPVVRATDPVHGLPEDRMTLDGRCFSAAGARLASCSGADGDYALGIIKQALVSQRPQVATYAPREALAYAHRELGIGFQPVIVNGTFPFLRNPYGPRGGDVRVRSGACIWWDLGCLIKGVVERTVAGLVQPRPVAGKPSGPARIYRMGSRVIAIDQGGSVIAVGNDKFISVPGVGLIGLDGATLLSDQGGALIGLDGATLIGLDGATLIGLDGATFRGKTPLVLTPPGIISDQGGS